MGVEIFANNARGVLWYGRTASAQDLVLEPGTGGRFATQRGVLYGLRFQRATLFNPDNPDVFEIVYVHSIYNNGENQWRLGVHRGMENTEPRDWPAGAIIEARVTAGMLEAFQHKTDSTSANATAPNPYTVRYDSHHSIDQGFGRVSVRATSVIPLSTHETLPIWEDGDDVPGWAMYRRLDVPDKYFVFDSETFGATLPSDWNSERTFTNATIGDGGVGYAGRGTWYETPVIDDLYSMDFGEVKGVITEVGFVCTEGSGDVPVTPPEVFFSIGYQTITKTLPAMKYGDVFRIPIPPQEGVAKTATGCGAGLLIETDVLFGGYFYAVMTPLLVEPMQY